MSRLQDVLVQGTRASQPAANTLPNGSLYYVTDEQKIEQTNGSVWSAYSGSSGALTSSRQLWQYKANTGATSGYPGDGKMLWNNATQTSATSLIFAHITSDGLDIDLFLAFLAIGNRIIIQDADASADFQEWVISGAPTNTNGGTSTSYWTVPVTLETSGGTGTTGFSNNHQLIAVIFGSSNTGVLQILTANPSTLVDETGWLFDDGGTPSSISLRVRKGGVTYDLPIGTLT